MAVALAVAAAVALAVTFARVPCPFSISDAAGPFARASPVPGEGEALAKGVPLMSFDAETVALEAVATVRPLLDRIKRCDKDLARQLARSATSMAQNLGEGRYSDPGTARSRFHSAAGSPSSGIPQGHAHETRVSLRIAIAWGYVSAAETRASLELIDRVVAMCFRLTRPKAR